ncbi:MAG: hypothetical protein AB2421_01770 [Thermotaleaceae bacterium]
MERNNTLKIASIYIGTVIGAGFASGQEIMQFFTVYGKHGLYGITLATLLFSFSSSYVLLKVYHRQIQSYHQWIQPIFGSGITRIFEVVLSLLLLSGYCIMLAGSGALLEHQFGFSKIVGVLLMSLVTFITFLFSIQGMAWINTMVVPLLFLGIITMGVWISIRCGFTMSNGTGAVLNTYTGNWFTSALLYVSYNSIGASVVMSSLLPLINNPKTAVKGGLLGGVGLGLLALFLLVPTLILYTDISGVELPMMAVASRLGAPIQRGYGILLWLAMLTTAISNGFVLIQTLDQHLPEQHGFNCFLFVLAAIPLANLGFKNLVTTLYPLFGYFGIGVLVFMLFRR